MHGVVLRLDPALLYRIVPGSAEGINDAGYRDAEFVPPSGRTRILMSGDSFVMGYNVPPDRTLPKALERELGEGHEVLNFGVLGDGPDQSLLRLRRDGLPLRPDAVLLGVFAANDFNDVLRNRLFRVDDGGALVPGGANPVTEALPRVRVLSLARKALTGHYLPREHEDRLLRTLFSDTYDLIEDPAGPEASEKIRLMQAVLRAWRDELRVHGIGFGVFVLPSYENIQNDHALRERGVAREAYFRNEDIVARLCETEGIPVLSLAGPFLSTGDGPLYDAEDRHLSDLGNRWAARFLRDLALAVTRDSAARRASSP